MEDVRVESWAELQQELFRDNWYVYRGVSTTEYEELETSIVRHAADPTAIERPMFRNFRRYARHHADADSHWRWLSLAQHHGLPTRLLDWTYSPLVALHFATSNTGRYGEDGVVWAVDAAAVNRLAPGELRGLLKQRDAYIFSTEMIEEVVGSFDDLENLQETPFPLFFEPPSLAERIVHQFGLFSMMSDVETGLREWLESHPDLFRRILVPDHLKWEVRNNLDQANVNERMLFPGLDGLTDWLKRYYHPENPQK